MICGETVGGAELASAFITANGREQDLLAVSSSTDGHRPCSARFSSHDRTFVGEVVFHLVIWILSRADGDRSVA